MNQTVLNLNSLKARILLPSFVVAWCVFGSVQSQSVERPTHHVAPEEVFSLLNASVEGEPIFLKLNDLYFLFMASTTPFISEEGVVYVPLRAMAYLLGGESIRIDAVDQEASFYRHDMIFLVDDEQVEAREVSTLDDAINFYHYYFDAFDKFIWLEAEEDVLVPAATLMKALRIEANWDPGTRVFEIRAPGALRDPSFLSARYGTLPRYSPIGGESTEALLPTAITLERVNPQVADRSYRLSLDIHGLTGVSGGVNLIQIAGGYRKMSERLEACGDTACEVSFELDLNCGTSNCLELLIADIVVEGEPLETFDRD